MNITVGFIFINTCCTREYQHRPLGPNESQTDHTQTVDQLSPDVDGLGPEPGHHLVQEEGVEGAGEAVHAHAPAGEPHALVIRPPPGTALGRSGVPAEHGLAHEVGEVEAVADQGAPAEQVSQTKPPIMFMKRLSIT